MVRSYDPVDLQPVGDEEIVKEMLGTEPSLRIDVVLVMRPVLFDQPVTIALGKPRKARSVRTVIEAISFLQSEGWPAKTGPFKEMAKDALDGARIGHVTPAEARQAFRDAAIEARVFLPSDTVH